MGKDKKKHKKEKKSKKHKKSRTRKPSTSDSSASSDEWVEKGTSLDPTPPRSLETKPAPVEREDDWSSVFGGVSTAEIRKAKELEKTREKVSMETKPGQSSRELNPYWKDGGTGLPPERDSGKSSFRKLTDDSEDSSKSSGSRFIRPEDDRSERKTDSRYRKDFHHSRSSEDKSSSRIDRFRRPVDDANSAHHSKFRRPDEDERFRRPDDEKRKDRTSYERFKRPDDGSGRFKKPEDGVRLSPRREFSRPDEGSSRSRYGINESSNSRRGWRKSDSSNVTSTTSPVQMKRDSSPARQKSIEKSPSPPPQVKILTSDEINELNAKIMRAEISGKMDVAAKLKKELENCRREETEKTVILTQTDSKGYTRPVKRDERPQGSKKKKKVQTHENSKRMRYFADDDDYSLQDMYEKEKYSSARDQEEDFMNLMGKEMSRKDGSLALDDPFEETASIDNREKKGKQQWDRAVRDQAKKEKIYDECKWCLGAKRMNEKLVVKSKQKVYLSCPPFQSLTEGHCLIIPHSHVSCSVQADEDVWDEVMELRKELVRKLEKNDEDCVFFETASYLHKHPHMIIHCVPLPREIGDMAPIYFKKALLDCESEWTDNKKVVDLAGRGVRKAVPKGLPYFFVDFGDQNGYAHVIEDLKLFPNNFAQEIIGGMLDLNHELWRKQRNVSEEELDKNLKYLKQLMNDDD